MKGHAEIAGGGFSGLAAAAALGQRGWTVRVHERSSDLRAFGAGIFVWENGLRVLDALGVKEPVLAGSWQAPRYEVRDHHNQLVAEKSFGVELGTRMITMTRQCLYQALLSAATRNGAVFETDSAAIAASPDGDLILANGARHRADLIIAADGVNSEVRDSLGLKQDRYGAGDFGAIRLLLPRATNETDNVIHHLSPPGQPIRRMLYVPCNDHDLYVAFTISLADSAAMSIPINRELWSATWPHMAEIFARVSEQGRWDSYETVRLRSWSQGRVAVIGDAAHGMAPTLGQGAGCAMMNALALAECLETAKDLQSGLAAWEANARPITEHTQDISHRYMAAAHTGEGGGTLWDEDALKTARYVPLGCG